MLKYLFIVLFAGTLTQEISAQIVRQSFHNEVEDQAYQFVNRNTMERGPSYIVRSSKIITTQVNVDENGSDILGDAANEPSIAIDPTNPNRIVIGWRQFDNINNNFRQAGYGYSLDGGLSFTFPGVIDPGLFRSDPVLDFDKDGNFYYNSLQGGFNCDVFQINDGGVEWEGPYPANGGDKQWMRIDRSGGSGDGHNYSYWSSNYTTCEPGQFTRSTDGSLTFEDCISVDGNPFWGTLAVDKNGVLYVTGTNGNSILLIKSKNAKNAGEDILWEFTTNVNLNGQLAVGQFINPMGLTGQVWVDVDISDGPGANNIYVLASVNPPGDDFCDVMFARSTDGGLSFEAPQKINTDPSGSYNWFGTLSVAPNGRIDVVWLDTRSDPASSNSRLFYSFSEDQGTTWSPNEPLSPSFDSRIGWPQQNKMGDYFDMVSDNDFAHLAWTNTISGGQNVYYTRISPSEIILSNLNLENNLISFFPNPANTELHVLSDQLDGMNTKIEVFNLMGQKVQTLLDGAVSGALQLDWKINATLENGIYFLAVETLGKRQIFKFILHR